MEKATISVAEAAKVLGIGRNLAYQLVRTGEIPAKRLGRRWLVLTQPLQEMLSTRCGGDDDGKHFQTTRSR